MYDEDPVDDEEELQKALALSMVPDPNAEAKPQANPPERLETEPNVPQTAEEKVDIDANFMKDVIGELGIDIDQNQLDDIVNEAKKDDKDKKKEEEKKD